MIIPPSYEVHDLEGHPLQEGIRWRGERNRTADFPSGGYQRLRIRPGGAAIRVRTDPAGRPHKVYVSRSRLAAEQRRLIGEEELERHLLACGWAIFHPERASLDDQLRIYGGPGASPAPRAVPSIC